MLKCLLVTCKKHLKSWRIDMTREESKQLLPIIQAFAEGKIIECRTKPGTISAGIPNEWTEIKEIGFWNGIEYRIKPEQKYRQFSNAEECWQELLKHKPFGWVKCKDNSIPGKFMHITSVRDNEVTISSALDTSYSELIKYYTFTDGTPVGVKEEE